MSMSEKELAQQFAKTMSGFARKAEVDEQLRTFWTELRSEFIRTEEINLEKARLLDEESSARQKALNDERLKAAVKIDDDRAARSREHSARETEALHALIRRQHLADAASRIYAAGGHTIEQAYDRAVDLLRLVDAHQQTRDVDAI